jgi:hypothetical protein
MTQLSRNRLQGIARRRSEADEGLSSRDEELHPELPTLSFAKSHVINDSAGDIHIEFHGRAHISGDVIIGFPPKIADGYPKPWPEMIDSVGRLAFDHISPDTGQSNTTAAHDAKADGLPWSEDGAEDRLLANIEAVYKNLDRR